HGNVTADKSGASEGESVTLTVTPSEGYNIGTVSYNDGSEHMINAVGGVYSFTMPAVSVTISATFTPIIYSIEYDLDGGTAENPTTYTVETEAFTLSAPTREHYRFTGWTLDGTDDDPSETITIPQGSTGNLKYVANWEELPYFAYHSMILSGQIGVEFYAHAPDGWEGEELSAVFTIGGNDYPEQIYDPELEADIDGGHYYGFRCYISSVQMADEIQAVLKCGDDEVETTIYTAKEYLDGLIADTSYPADTIVLGKAIKNYGSYVQPVLAKANGWKINVDHAKMDSVDAYAESDFDTVRTAVAGHAISKDIEGTGVSDIKYTLYLNAETTIEVLLTPESGKSISNVKVNGKENGAEIEGGVYRVQIAGISAHKLGNIYTITGNAGGSKDFTVKVSALSYVQGALNDDDETVEMKRAVTSLYKYYDATKTYRDNRPNEYK
ncbi:MAG: InlB B-repeat-containing protein, partial [Synergistaceae bacterium]|nr:InlB B-repeat-containing protein [Synergistaceae bacterium]